MWQNYFKEYERQVQYAKRVLKINYDPNEICVNCVVYHTMEKNLQFDISCNPIPRNQFDVAPTSNAELLQLVQSNAYFFARYILKLEPREFQKHIMACTQKRKVLRIARRQGKSHALAMYILWYQFTHPRQRIRIAAPRDIQVMELFDKMNEFIVSSEILQQSFVKHNRKDQKFYKREPYEFVLTNGSTIRGITTGDGDGTSVRSQSADLLVLDEADFITDESYQAIYPIIATSTNTELIVQSTPSGRRSYFYSWCHDKAYKELKLSYHQIETYDPKIDEEFRRTMTKEQYEREILADFTLQEQGVFPNELIDQQLEDYDFDSYPPPPGVYTIGVDWNESLAGVHIVILRYELHHQKFRVSNIIIVEPSEFTQIMQVDKIIELYEIYRPKKIVMDEGYGATQIQQLKRWAITNDENMLQVLQSVQFSSKVQLLDPLTGQFQDVYIKPYMVQLTSRLLEDNKLILPHSQDYKTKLVGQMRDYMVESVLENGNVRYSKGNVHTLEQLFLQIYGMYLVKDFLIGNSGQHEYTRTITPRVRYSRKISISGKGRLGDLNIFYRGRGA